MYHIAQINIAEMLYPKGHPQMQPFFDAIAEINALAEQSAGFVWRLKDEAGDATEIKVFDNDMLIVNMSVWDSIDALYQFTYYSNHAGVYRQRRDWFHQMKIYFAMWYVPIGTIPTTDNAKTALKHLEEHGATPLAFTFKERFSLEEFLAYPKP
jgi:hypothetical protein